MSGYTYTHTYTHTTTTITLAALAHRGLTRKRYSVGLADSAARGIVAR